MSETPLSRSYSMPIGGAHLYPAPPYLYRDVEDMFIAYETDRAQAETFLPPHVTVADDPAYCVAWGRWAPFTSFGPYHESYVLIRVSFKGETYLYLPFIFTDSEPPLAAGREIWGYPKKLGVMEHFRGGAGVPYGEQLLFTTERPKGKRIMTMTMACDKLADPSEIPAFPVLSFRMIPNSESGRRPSVAELVRVDGDGVKIHTSMDGTLKLWEGRGSVTMDSASEVDPWHRLAPIRMLKAWYGIFDFDIPHGKPIHNYLHEPELWS